MQIEHHYTTWQWVNHHWFEISMVWFPAFLGYLNAFVASCKVMGWDRLAVELGKIEDALRTFIANVKSQNQTGGSNVQNTSNGPAVPTTSTQPGPNKP